MVNFPKTVERLLSTKEAANFLGMSTQWLITDRHKAKQGGTPPVVPFVKIGTRTVRYRYSDLLSAIDETSA